MFGVSDGDVRSLSVFFALASIPFVMLMARRLGGGTGGIWAGVLLVASPHFIYFGGEARMYSLLWFWVMTTAWLTVRTEGRVQARRRLGLWTITSVAGFLTHYFFLFPWVLFVAFLVLNRRRPPRKWTIVACAAVVLLLLPWYWHVPESLRNWRVTQDWLNVPPGGFVRWRATLELFTQYFSGHGQHVWWEHPIAQTFALALFAALLLPAIRRERIPWGRGERLLPWAWWMVVCLGPVVFDVAKNTYTVAVPRYGLMALPAVCLIGAMALMNFGVIGRTVLGLGIVAAWVPHTWGIFQDVDRNDQRYWHIGWVLDREATEKDLVLVHSIPSGVLGVARYTHSAAEMAGWVQQLGDRRLPESINRLIAGKSRVFFVNIHNVGADAPEEQWLRERFPVVREERISSAQLVVFDVEGERKGGATRPAPRS
jgi:4-amino-4-deoxy-L-arabinose transferase-like glycosyltransferase